MNRKFIYKVAIILCLVAVFPLPYDFYAFLRLAVTLASIVAAFELKGEGNFLWLLFCGVALVFNPFFPINLDKGLWVVIDLTVAGCFGWIGFRDEI